MRKKGCIIFGIGGFVTVLVLLVAAIAALSGGAAPEFTVLNEERQTVKPDPENDVPVVLDNGLRLQLPFGVSTKPSPIVVKELAVKGGNVSVEKAYDIDFDLSEGSGALVELAIPVTAAKLAEGEFLNALRFNESEDEWEPMPCLHDLQDNYLLVFSEHFSKYGYARAEMHSGTGLDQKIANVPFPSKRTMSDVAMKRIINAYNSPDPRAKNPYVAAWNANMKFFAISSNASALWENAFQLQQLAELNKVVTEAGMGLAIMQLALDIYVGEPGPGLVNFTKSAINYALAKGFNTTFMNLALVNIFCIDYALAEFAKEAIDGRYQIYEKASALYYVERQKKHGENAVWWYKKLKKIMIRKSQKPGDAKKAVDDLFSSYFNTFWEDSTLVAEYQERILKRNATPWTGTAGMNKKLKRKIYRNRMHDLRSYLTAVFDKIELELYVRQMGLTREKLVKAADRMNKYRKFKVSIHKDLAKSLPNSDLANLQVQFDVKRDHKYWTMQTDSDGEITFKATMLSYVQAGAPTQATLSVPFGNEIKTYRTTFTLAPAGKETEIVFQQSILLGFHVFRTGIEGHVKYGDEVTRYPPAPPKWTGRLSYVTIVYPFERNKKNFRVIPTGKYSCRLESKDETLTLTFDPKNQTLSGSGSYHAQGDKYEEHFSYSVRKTKRVKGIFAW